MSYTHERRHFRLLPRFLFMPMGRVREVLREWYFGSEAKTETA